MRQWIPTPPEADAGDGDGNRAQRMLGVFDADPGAELAAIVNVTKQAFSCPVAMINIFDGPHVRFAAQQGIEGIDCLPRDQTFCETARTDGRLLVVENAAEDARFANLAPVSGPMGLRFYAGVPLRLRQADGAPGAVVGTVCIADTQPRRFAEPERRALIDIASVVETVIHARRSLADAIAIAEERSQRGRQLRRADRQFRQAERMANMGSWRYPIGGDQVELSDQGQAIHGLEPEGPIPSVGGALDMYPPESRKLLSDAVAACIESGESFDLELDAVSAGGLLRVRVMGELELVHGIAHAVIGVVQDITDRYRLEEALRRSAEIDDLTRIANRAAFGRTLEARIDAVRADGAPLALLLIDLDGYKAINDTHGHPAGDEVLRQVAERLSATPCLDAFAARLGGDELALIVSNAEDCRMLADHVGWLLREIAQPVTVGGVPIAVSGTIGIAWFEPGIAGVRELVQRADRALYDAKRHRRGIARTFGTADVIEPLAERRGC